MAEATPAHADKRSGESGARRVDAPEGDGESVYVMWDGDAHFDGVASDAMRKVARAVVEG